MASPEECPWGLQTVQPFAYVKSGSFLITKESGEHWGCKQQGGPGGMLPQKMSFEIWCSEMLILCSARKVIYTLLEFM